MTITDERSAPATGAAAIDLERVQRFALQVAGDHGAAANAVLVYLGDRLGLWRALASGPAVTSEELAQQTGLAERYLREWLAAQAAAGYVEYDPGTGCFRLPPEHAAVLADDDSPAALIGAFEITAGAWAASDRMAHAYATGDGLAWHEQDPRIFTGVERFYRPLYHGSLVDAWLPSVDGLVDRLRAGIRVLDVGCGFGSPTLLMAEAFPASTFVGVDYHEQSVRGATAAAERAGVQDRVRFEQAGAEEYARGPYDLICFFDALHDMGDPVGALRHARGQLADDGVVLAVEPLAGDRLEETLQSPLARSWFAGSASLCVPNSLSQPGQAALGAQAGPARTVQVFRDAGFGTARLATATDFNMVVEGRG